MSIVAEIAIVGSGPSGFYAAEALLRSERRCRIDMFERLPMPFGLVRYGVAPDHQKLKSVTAIFERIAASEGMRLFCGVHVGRDITIAELLEQYHAVIIACGTSQPRTLGVVGEMLPDVCPSTQLVGWYNGHPEFVCAQPLSLNAESVIVLGHGNVAIDATRLLSRPVEQLVVSDVPHSVLAALRASRVRTVHLIGRGAPGRAKFTAKELRELGQLDDVRVVFPQGNERLFAALQASPGNADLLPVWQSLAQQQCAHAVREIHIWFGLNVSEFRGRDQLEAVRLQCSDTSYASSEDGTVLPAEHAITCIGYRGEPLSDVPFDNVSGTIVNVHGRVLSASGDYLKGLYVTGWIKRGPTGVIGTNRADSLDTTAALLEDWPALIVSEKSGGRVTEALLRNRSVRTFSFADWQALDRVERSRAREGAPREKVLSYDEAVSALPQR